MAVSAEHIKALVGSHPSGDGAGLYAIELQVAAKAGQRYRRLASDPKETIDASSHEPTARKTMTAAVVAHDISLELLTPRYDTLLIRFLGGTASTLRTVFEAVAAQQAVYLFKESDALGGMLAGLGKELRWNQAYYRLAQGF